MKKLVYIIASVAAGLFLLSSCEQKAGTEPGNDTAPVVTVYNYAAGAEYDSDADQRVRFVSNGKVTKACYLVEKSADKKAFIEAQGEEAYAQKVLNEGKEIAFEDGVYETIITGMTGDYDITSAATDGSKNTLRSVSFSGIPWDISSSIEGKYYVRVKNIADLLGSDPFPATLQRHQDDPTIYRIKGALGPGTKLTIQLIDKKGVDTTGEYTFFRIPEQATPYTFSSYGTVSVRDLGYWQGDAAYVTDYGYESGMYANGQCFLCLQYYVSAGSLGYGYEYFIPNN